MTRRFKFSKLTALAGATIATVAAPTGAQAFSLGDYNLVVFGDLTSNSEVEGNSFIGGNLYGDSANFCTHCTPESTFYPFDGVGLKVVGDINGNPKQINNGTDLEYSGDLDAEINLNGGGSQTYNSDLASEFDDLKIELLGISSQLAALDSNSSVTVPDQQPGAVSFESSGEKYAVFNIDVDDLFSTKTQQIELNLNGSETAIINVSGKSVHWTNGNMVGALNNNDVRQKVIWNFYEAEELKLDNLFQGSLLAPQAKLMNQTPIEGTVIVDSFYQQGEVHKPTFNGYLPEPDHPPSEAVPEPSSIVGIAAVLGLGATLRRKGKQ